MDTSYQEDFFKACERGNLEKVKFLVAKKEININLKDKYGLAPLIYASRGGHNDVVNFLIESDDIDIEVKDKYGKTCLSHISSYDYPETVKFLLKKGANVETKCNNGWTPLFHSCHGRSFDIVKLLVEEGGANIEAKDNDGQTALFLAAIANSLDIIKFLVSQAGANTEVKNNNGYKFTEYVANSSREEEIIKFVKDFQKRKEMVKPCKK